MRFGADLLLFGNSRWSINNYVNSKKVHICQILFFIRRNNEFYVISRHTYIGILVQINEQRENSKTRLEYRSPI